MSTPNQIEYTKEIMIAYIQSLGEASTVLFPKSGSENAATESFEGTWERILKVVSVPDQTFSKAAR